METPWRRPGGALGAPYSSRPPASVLVRPWWTGAAETRTQRRAHTLTHTHTHTHTHTRKGQDRFATGACAWTAPTLFPSIQRSLLLLSLYQDPLRRRRRRMHVASRAAREDAVSSSLYRHHLIVCGCVWRACVSCMESLCAARLARVWVRTKQSSGMSLQLATSQKRIRACGHMPCVVRTKSSTLVSRNMLTVTRRESPRQQ